MVRRVGAHLKCLTALSWTQATLDTPDGDLLDGEMMDLSVEDVHGETNNFGPIVVELSSMLQLTATISVAV